MVAQAETTTVMCKMHGIIYLQRPFNNVTYADWYKMGIMECDFFAKEMQAEVK